MPLGDEPDATAVRDHCARGFLDCRRGAGRTAETRHRDLRGACAFVALRLRPPARRRKGLGKQQLALSGRDPGRRLISSRNGGSCLGGRAEAGPASVAAVARRHTGSGTIRASAQAIVGRPAGWSCGRCCCTCRQRPLQPICNPAVHAKGGKAWAGVERTSLKCLHARLFMEAPRKPVNREFWIAPRRSPVRVR
jgi:hypothetical protein